MIDRCACHVLLIIISVVACFVFSTIISPPIFNLCHSATTLDTVAVFSEK